MDINLLYFVYIYIHIIGKYSYLISKRCSTMVSALVRLGETFPRSDGQ